MKRINWLLVCFLFLTVCTFATQAAAATPGSVLNGYISSVEGEFVPAAEAMPEDKYSFAPTNGEFKGARTYGQQIKHVAAVNYMIAAAILGEKPPVELGGESGPDNIKTKADIVKFLKDSFAYVHKAVPTINESNSVEAIASPFSDKKTTRLELAAVIAGHCFDHYGQMVVYLRMNGIIPPASR